MYPREAIIKAKNNLNIEDEISPLHKNFIDF